MIEQPAGSARTWAAPIEKNLRRFWRTALLAGVALLISTRGRAQEAPDDFTPAPESGTAQLGGQPGRLPSDAFRNNPDVTVRSRSLFRNSRDPFSNPLHFSERTPGGGSETAGERLGLPGVEVEAGGARLELPRLDAGLRLNTHHGFNILNRGFEPEDADLKIGPIFFKLRALSAAVLVSDNVNFSPDDRQSGAIAIARISASVVAQLTESLRLAFSGSVIWLPFKGKVGLTSNSGFFDFGLNERGSEGTQVAEITWDGHLGEWDLYVADTFDAYGLGLTAPFSTGYYEKALFEGSQFNEVDQAGRYRFGSYGQAQAVDRDFTENTRDGNLSTDLLGYSNRIEARAQRLLPGPIRLQIRVYRDDLWYNQGTRGLPKIREGLTVTARSERENMRFKPFVRYDAYRNSDMGPFGQSIIAGLTGPITDQLRLSVYAGEYFPATSNESRFLAGLSLLHTAGPYTSESLFVGREVRDFLQDQELIDRATYTIDQVLGPRLNAYAYVSYEIARALDGSSDQRDEIHAGAGLNFIPGPRTTIRLSYRYTRLSSDNPNFLFPVDNRTGGTNSSTSSTATTQTIGLQIAYLISENTHLSLQYRYQQRETSEDNSFIYENVAVLALSRYFY